MGPLIFSISSYFIIFQQLCSFPFDITSCRISWIFHRKSILDFMERRNDAVYVGQQLRRVDVAALQGLIQRIERRPQFPVGFGKLQDLDAGQRKEPLRRQRDGGETAAERLPGRLIGLVPLDLPRI